MRSRIMLIVAALGLTAIAGLVGMLAIMPAASTTLSASMRTNDHLRYWIVAPNTNATAANGTAGN